ncbi:hypothetical protein PIB30_057122 [Stylosanthes scabra]|uniref:Uncharacterized protein n=1 Tax=Stylosanthes scabra TaxID=79078 RepID=A0ABU6RJU6_9FABA|nr:hypothetical protein [Stylosanthes scabra]
MAKSYYLSNQGLNQVEYASDSGSDGYYICKEQTISYKNLEWQQRNLPDELFKILAQERNEIREVQKKTEVQLGLLIKLATLIVETLTNSSTSRQEDEVLAVTLKSGKQLEKPPLTTHHMPSEIPKEVYIQHGERNTQDMPEVVTTSPQQITTEDGRQTPLPYPVSTRRKRQAKTIDPQIVELLKNVEVTLPHRKLTSRFQQYASLNSQRRACVNIMPLSIYKMLPLNPLTKSSAKFVLADKSVTTVAGKAKDVLRRIGELDAFTGTFSFAIGAKRIHFNIKRMIREPVVNYVENCDDEIDKLVVEVRYEEEHHESKEISMTHQPPEEADKPPKEEEKGEGTLQEDKT